MPGSVRSGSASWDDCGRMFHDKLRVSSFPDWFPHVCLRFCIDLDKNYLTVLNDVFQTNTRTDFSLFFSLISLAETRVPSRRYTLSKSDAEENVLLYVRCSWGIKNLPLSQLNGALSPVNHKGLHQGWIHTSLYLQAVQFTSHQTTSHVFFCVCVFFFFLIAYLYSAGTQHGNPHPAGWPILFCGPT